MTDEKLRGLERRFQESGSAQDEAAWLCERIRQGDLSQEMLELAALCGHLPSASVAESGRQGFVYESIEYWLQQPVFQSPQVLERAGIAALAELTAHDPGLLEEEQFKRAFQSLVCQVLTEKQPTEAEYADLLEFSEEMTMMGDGHYAAASIVAAGFMICSTEANFPYAVGCAANAIQLLGQSGDEVVWEAIRSSLIPWALGYGDPLLERLRALGLEI